MEGVHEGILGNVFNIQRASRGEVEDVASLGKSFLCCVFFFFLLLLLLLCVCFLMPIVIMSITISSSISVSISTLICRISITIIIEDVATLGKSFCWFRAT